MYFFDVNIFASQMIPPNWRGGKLLLLKSLFKPVSILLQEFEDFRESSRKLVNITPQTMVIEYRLRVITGIWYGIYISESPTIKNHFTVNIPASGQASGNEIKVFLKQTVPAGRKYTINFY